MEYLCRVASGDLAYSPRTKAKEVPRGRADPTPKANPKQPQVRVWGGQEGAHQLRREGRRRTTPTSHTHSYPSGARRGEVAPRPNSNFGRRG